MANNDYDTEHSVTSVTPRRSDDDPSIHFNYNDKDRINHSSTLKKLGEEAESCKGKIKYDIPAGLDLYTIAGAGNLDIGKAVLSSSVGNFVFRVNLVAPYVAMIPKDPAEKEQNRDDDRPSWKRKRPVYALYFRVEPSEELQDLLEDQLLGRDAEVFLDHVPDVKLAVFTTQFPSDDLEKIFLKNIKRFALGIQGRLGNLSVRWGETHHNFTRLGSVSAWVHNGDRHKAQLEQKLSQLQSTLDASNVEDKFKQAVREIRHERRHRRAPPQQHYEEPAGQRDLTLQAYTVSSHSSEEESTRRTPSPAVRRGRTTTPERRLARRDVTETKVPMRSALFPPTPQRHANRVQGLRATSGNNKHLADEIIRNINSTPLYPMNSLKQPVGHGTANLENTTMSPVLPVVPQPGKPNPNAPPPSAENEYAELGAGTSQQGEFQGLNNRLDQLTTHFNQMHEASKVLQAQVMAERAETNRNVGRISGLLETLMHNMSGNTAGDVYENTRQLNHDEIESAYVQPDNLSALPAVLDNLPVLPAELGAAASPTSNLLDKLQRLPIGGARPKSGPSTPGQSPRPALPMPTQPGGPPVRTRTPNPARGQVSHPAGGYPPVPGLDLSLALPPIPHASQALPPSIDGTVRDAGQPQQPQQPQ